MVFPLNENLISPAKVSALTTSALYPLGRRILLPLYFHEVRVVGQDNFPQQGPVLIAPTHRSRWDGLIVAHGLGRPATGRNLRYMVSVNEMRGGQGWLIRQCGGFAINPDAPSVSEIRYGVDLLLNQEALVVFGEGDIFRDRSVRHIKPGLSRIALQAQRRLEKGSNFNALSVQILPVGLCYSQPCPQRGCSVEVRIGKPIAASDYLAAPCKTAAAALTADLKSSLNHLMKGETEFSMGQIAAQPS